MREAVAIRLPKSLLHRLFRFRRGMTLGVRVMVMAADERVLLVRHTYSKGWNFPGGGVERGEEALAALRREVIEESGVRLLGEPQLFGVYANERNFRGDHIVFYVAREFERGAFAPTAEIADARFFAPRDIPPDTTAGTLRRIAEVTDGRSPDGHW